jgi:hypothetical protein
MVLVGHLRLLRKFWFFWKAKTAGLVTHGLVSVAQEVEWEIPRGTILNTPFGLAMVRVHRLKDDIVEMTLRGGGTLYRSARLSVKEDAEL